MRITAFHLLTVLMQLSAFVFASTINVPDDYDTIQAALNAADSSDTVLVQPGTYYENIFWPDVGGIKLISAGDSSNTIIDGGASGSVIYMNPSTATIDSTTEIQGFKITNGGNITGGGGIFVNSASPVLTRLWVTGNTATADGGGLYIYYYSNPILTNVTVSGNTANRGGGLYISGASSPTLTHVSVSGNTFSDHGGGLYIAGSPTLTDVTVSGNTGGSRGGGLYIGYGSPTLTDVTVSGNTAGHGGGFYMLGDISPTLMNVAVTGNMARAGGGGLYMYNSSTTLTNLSVTGNTAVVGGGLALYGSSPTLTDMTVSGNTANRGGGFHISRGSPTLTHITVSRNTVDAQGGGLYIAGSATLIDVPVSGNTAAAEGGGLYIAGSATLTDATVSGNTAGSNGGGLYITGRATLTRFTVSKNLGTGLFFGVGGDGWLENVTVTGNTRGIYVESGTLIIAGSNIAYHGIGLHNADNTNIVSAVTNWWGDVSGPYHPQQNPGGLGDSVSAFVNITPWLTEPDTAAPPIPVQNLTIDSTGYDFVILSWDASPIGDLAGYKIYFGTESSGFPYADTIDVGNTELYTLSGLGSGLTYYIVATCYDTDGNESWYSKEVNTAPKDIMAPAAPQNLMAEAGDSSVTLAWSPNSELDLSHYVVYQSTKAGFTPTSADSGAQVSAPDTNIILTGLANDTTYYFRITAVDSAGNYSGFSAEVSTTPVPLTLDSDVGVPGKFALYQNYPNPFNPSTTIRFDLPEASEVYLVVYDLLGGEVAHLANGRLEAGYHSLIWNGKDARGREVPTGLYIARLVTASFTKSIKLVLLK